MIQGAARRGGCEKYTGFAAQYFRVDKSGFSPGRNWKSYPDLFYSRMDIRKLAGWLEVAPWDVLAEMW